MALFTELLLELVALVGAVVLIGFLVLLFRNPHCARWLRAETAQTTAALVVVAASVFTFSSFTSGLSDTGLSLFVVFPVAVAVLAVITFVAARLFSFRARLERADAGHNPFHSMAERPEKQAAPQIEGGYR